MPDESTAPLPPRAADHPAGARLALGVLALFVLALAAYRPILPGSFLMDDQRLIATDNPLVNGQFSLLSIWFQTDFALSDVALWAQWLAWGQHPGWYHAVNLLLHSVSAALVWGVLRRLRIPGAWLAAALFALHPVCVNSVARIAEVKNTLSLPFFLLSLWLLLPDLDDTAGRHRSLRYGLSIIAFVVALMAKTSTIMLPLVYLAVVVWRNGRLNRESVLRAVPLLGIALAFGLMSAWFQKHQAMTGPPLPPESFGQRLALAGRAYWFYLGKALWPVNLNLVYPRWQFPASSPWSYFSLLLVFVVMAACWFCGRGRGRAALLGLVVFGIALFPALGFFESQFLTKWQVSDHLQYLPLIAPVALAAAAMATWLPATVFRVVGLALLAALFGLTFQRAKVFSSEETLFRDTLAKNPAAWGIHNDLGVLLAARHDFAGAEAQFLAALDSNHDYPDAESNLGQLLFVEGKPKEAGARYLLALKGEPNNPLTHRRFAALLAREGRMEEALGHEKLAILFSPKPDLRLLLDCAGLLHQVGDVHGAEAQFRAALALNPDSVEALNNLAWLLATASDPRWRDGAEAVRLAGRASKLPVPQGMSVTGTMAAAYAEAGRFPEAIATAQKAIQEETAAGQTSFAAFNQKLLELYQLGRPYYQSPTANSRR